MSTQNEIYQKTVDTMEGYGVAKEEMLLGAQGLAMALVSHASFSANILPASMQFIKSEKDLTADTYGKFLKDNSLTMAVILATCNYVNSRMKGESFDKESVQSFIDNFSSADAEGQYNATIDVLGCADETLINLVANTVGKEMGIDIREKFSDKFSEIVAEHKGFNINSLLEEFSVVLMTLASLVQMDYTAVSEQPDVEFNDILIAHRKIGSLLAIPMSHAAKVHCAELMRNHLQSKLSAEQYDIIYAMLEMGNSAGKHEHSIH